MARLKLHHRVHWLPIAVAVACTAALALLLFTGVRLAARLQSTSAALQLASSLTTQPQFLRSELTLIQRGLETQTYVGNSLRALAASRAVTNSSYAQLKTSMTRGGVAARTDTAALFASANAHWQPIDAGLARLEKARSADCCSAAQAWRLCCWQPCCTSPGARGVRAKPPSKRSGRWITSWVPFVR